MNDGLRISVAGLALIKRFEGLRLLPYLDQNGNRTIGYGHKCATGESFPQGISMQEADSILAADAAVAEQAVKRLVTVPLTQGQFDALVDFTFQNGQGNLRDSSMLSALNSGRYNAVPACLYHVDDAGEPHGWIFADGKPQPGIIARRQADIELWNS